MQTGTEHTEMNFKAHNTFHTPREDTLMQVRFAEKH